MLVFLISLNRICPYPEWGPSLPGRQSGRAAGSFDLAGPREACCKTACVILRSDKMRPINSQQVVLNYCISNQFIFKLLSKIT